MKPKWIRPETKAIRGGGGGKLMKERQIGNLGRMVRTGYTLHTGQGKKKG